MVYKLLIPLIVFILLQNISFLSESSDVWLSEFHQDLRLLSCARTDVYQRNIAEALKIFVRQDPKLEGRYEASDFIDSDNDPESCEGQSYAIYREYNPKLPAVYPNWVFRETERGS